MSSKRTSVNTDPFGCNPASASVLNFTGTVAVCGFYAQLAFVARTQATATRTLARRVRMSSHEVRVGFED